MRLSVTQDWIPEDSEVEIFQSLVIIERILHKNISARVQKDFQLLGL